ncbi:hypothetical protein [Methylobacterium sp. J-076]|uniref:hypothetical protein n=1 Tax=Methylobacterium sp. J-076 TaxID=2836655 RepID=UPI001FB889FD|nr:hypothetical protein [Methylobacterium sp. J-076]MCJ2011256.1 hypothetical protein [Methylobacterium sp. J-076]
MQIHTASAAMLRSLNLPGIGAYGIEHSFSLGDTARYGLNGSIRTDVVMRDGRKPDAPILSVWDIKTGEARLSAKRAAEIRKNLNIDSEVPVIELHIKRGVSVKSYICRY